MARAHVLIVDDDELVRWGLRTRFEQAGYQVTDAGTAADGLAKLNPAIDLVLLDVNLPDGHGHDVLRQMKQEFPETPVIQMTAGSTIESAVEAMKLGAFTYLSKPFDLDVMVLTADKALEASGLQREVRALRTGQGRDFGFEAIIGVSPAMATAKQLMARVASSPASTVLITGETGTGKDLAARAIHFNSARAGKPFVNITCSALPEALLESELFGHERGAFTDARQQKRGLVETAHGGTLFLDEIGEMQPGLQAKLLRFLEEKTFKRVGGLQDVRVDVRVIAATNRDLEKDVEAGTYREDLFYRLQVMAILLPPLRERTGDIPLLVDHYIDRYNREFRKRVLGITPAGLSLLESHPWHGNVRELRNVIERAMLLLEGEWIDAIDLGPILYAGAIQFRLPAEGVKLEEVERELVVQALDRAQGNQTHAGQLLGINRDQVRYRIEKFALAARG